MGAPHDYAYIATQNSVGDRSAQGGGEGEVYDMKLSNVRVALPPELQLGILQVPTLVQRLCAGPPHYLTTASPPLNLTFNPT